MSRLVVIGPPVDTTHERTTSQSGVKEALDHPLIVQHIASTLNTSQISSRKVALEILTFLCYWEDGVSHDLVIQALEALSTANNDKGPYEYWFRSLEGTLLGRGKMGSLVGASEEVRRIGGLDSSLNEYAVSARLRYWS